MNSAVNLWVRKLHIYAGLLNFTALTVFGLAGLVVTMDAPDIFKSGIPPGTITRDFTAPATASDKEVAAQIASLLQPAHAGLPNIHRDTEHHLVADMYSVNGLVRATVLDKSSQLRVETYRNSIWRFFDNAHATTISEKTGDNAVHAWAWYIELSIWSLVAMTLSGVWLGVTSRWNFRWTRVSLAAGCAAFVALYWLER